MTNDNGAPREQGTYEERRDAAALDHYHLNNDADLKESLNRIAPRYSGFCYGADWARDEWHEMGPLKAERDALQKQCDELRAKHEELLSYLPKVPTEPYARDMARKLDATEQMLQQAERKVKELKAELAEISAENERYRKEMAKITNGIPSEWAYAVLKKDRDALHAALVEIKQKTSPEYAIYRIACDALGGITRTGLPSGQ